MNSDDFDKRTRELYKEYLKHCADDGILLPAPYPMFKRKVQEQIAFMTAHKVADKNEPRMDGSEATFYVCVRVDDLDKPVMASIQKECCQCHAAVWADPVMAKRTEKYNAQVVCNRCVGEITGKSNEEIIAKELGELSDEV